MTAPLVLFFNGTFVNVENGAHARMRNLLRWAMTQFSNLVLYSFADHPDCPWGEKEIALFYRDYPGVELVLDRRSKALDRATKLKNACLTLAPRFAGEVLRWHVKGATPGFDRLKARGARTMIVNYADAISQLNGVDPADCIIETHDLKFLHYAKKFSRPVWDGRVMGKLRSEAYVLNAAGGLIAIAPPESAMFRLWFPHTPVFYVPSYPEAAAVSARARMAARYDLLFVGSENHFNVDGITAFLAANAAWLSRYRIALAGRVCAVQSVRELAAQNANITLLGFVEDLEEFYGAAWAAISPVEGTGLKMKVVEALRYGKPVFASAHSANSLPPGSEGCVFPLNEASIARLFKNIPAYEAACLSALAYGAAIDGAGESEKLRALLVERMESSVRRAAPEPHAVLAEAVL